MFKINIQPKELPLEYYVHKHINTGKDTVCKVISIVVLAGNRKKVHVVDNCTGRHNWYYGDVFLQRIKDKKFKLQ